MRFLGFAIAASLVIACGSDRAVKVRQAPQTDPFRPILADKPNSGRIANYVIAAELDAGKRRITAKQTLTWTNTGATAVTYLPFHLYMNAFKNERSVFMRESKGSHRRAQASTSDWGWIDIKSVRIGGADDVKATLSYPGPDDTVVHLPLAQPLPAGKTITVEFDFTVQLPRVFARTGFQGDFMMVGQWFPKIGVRTGGALDGTWHCKPFHLNSEFFADFGTYDVTLTVPTTHVIAATGVLTKVTDASDGKRTLTYRAEDVHDFAWMADPFMEVIKGKATTKLGDVEVRVYYRPEQKHFARRHLRAGIGAIEHFSKLLVPYPWPVMSIIDPPMHAVSGAGGMEYPTLVTTAGDSVFSRPGIRFPEFVTVHEVGHNWFQGILASNEVEEAWLDEGVNEYADGLVMTALYGEADLIDWAGWKMTTFEAHELTAGKVSRMPDPIATPSYAFSSNAAYGAASYAKTALALRTLEHVVGSKRFMRGLKRYAKSHAFGHPTGRDFFAALEAEAGQSLGWFVKPVFYERGYVDFRVDAITCARAHAARGVFRADDKRDRGPTDGWNCIVRVVNLGSVPVPTQVELVFADGSRRMEPWANKKAWKRIAVHHTSPVVEAHIDPHHRVMLDPNPLPAWKRTQHKSAASRRAGARSQFWIQSLMQLGGL